MALCFCGKRKRGIIMWIATIIVAYLVLSLVGMLIFYCAIAIASRVAENSQEESEASVVERSAEFSALSNDILTSTSESTAQEVAAQSHSWGRLPLSVGNKASGIDPN